MTDELRQRISHEYSQVKSAASQDARSRGHTVAYGALRLLEADGSDTVPAVKCFDGAESHYFCVSPSAPLHSGETILWDTERWRILETSILRSYRVIRVRQVIAVDHTAYELLDSAGLNDAPKFILDAEAHLAEERPEAWADCVSDCRSAFLSVLGHLGLDQKASGVKQLRGKCDFGDREEEHLEALERLLQKEVEFLSKHAAKGLMPDRVSATFALEITKASLKFVVLKLKP